MTDFTDLQSPKALVCKQQHRCDAGVGTAWFVCLADGYLIDCGAESYSEARANLVAAAINEVGPDRLGKDALAKWRPA